MPAPSCVIKGVAIPLLAKEEWNAFHRRVVKNENPLERKREKYTLGATDGPVLSDRPLVIAPRERQEYFRIQRPSLTVQGRRRKLLARYELLRACEKSYFPEA